MSVAQESILTKFFFVIVPILELKPAYAELAPEIDDAYRRVMASGQFLLGPELEGFESEFARAVGAADCVGVGNGLEALQMVLMAIGVGAGDEVIVPANGYIATWLAVTQTGAKPVPCEPDPATYNLDPGRLAALVTPRTKAVIPIHLYGQAADMEAIMAFASARRLFVLEDAAQSHGARCRGRPCGSLGHAAAFSFYPSKNLGAFADAGAVATNDAALADKLRYMRNYGAVHRYQNEVLGMNSRLGELQAAFLRVRLTRLQEWNSRRAGHAARYREQLQGVGDLVLPAVPAWADPVWHLFVLRTRRREKLQSYLADRGIGTQVHYPTPPHLSGAYRGLGWKRGDFPLSEKLADEVLSLPIGPHLRAEQLDYVCETARSFFSR